jgi:hypothetical protein
MIKLIKIDTHDLNTTDDIKHNPEDEKQDPADEKQISEDRKGIKQSFRLDLTKSKSAWIEIAKVPDELCTYAQSNFDTLFQLHPAERGKVIMGQNCIHNETESTRWHASYLNTPKWDK